MLYNVFMLSPRYSLLLWQFLFVINIFKAKLKHFWHLFFFNCKNFCIKVLKRYIYIEMLKTDVNFQEEYSFRYSRNFRKVAKQMLCQFEGDLFWLNNFGFVCIRGQLGGRNIKVSYMKVDLVTHRWKVFFKKMISIKVILSCGDYQKSYRIRHKSHFTTLIYINFLRKNKK